MAVLAKLKGLLNKKGPSVVKAFEMAKKAQQYKTASVAFSSMRKARPTLTSAAKQRMLGTAMAAGATNKASNTGSLLMRIGSKVSNLIKPIGHAGLEMARSGPGKNLLRGGFALGAVSMIGLNVLKGGMNEAKETIHERYMQDYTYSRSMLHNSRVGLASGTNRMLNRGGTAGLSNALHKTRHGRY